MAHRGSKKSHKSKVSKCRDCRDTHSTVARTVYHKADRYQVREEDEGVVSSRSRILNIKKENTIKSKFLDFGTNILSSSNINDNGSITKTHGNDITT